MVAVSMTAAASLMAAGPIVQRRLAGGSLDLFGCDRERPFARIDRAGLLWLLSWHELVALTRDTATIETSTGARQTYRRGAVEPGSVVLAWELPNGVSGHD
jgi:hypothetical protein